MSLFGGGPFEAMESSYSPHRVERTRRETIQNATTIVIVCVKHGSTPIMPHNNYGVDYEWVMAIDESGTVDKKTVSDFIERLVTKYGENIRPKIRIDWQGASSAQGRREAEAVFEITTVSWVKEYRGSSRPCWALHCESCDHNAHSAKEKKDGHHCPFCGFTWSNYKEISRLHQIGGNAT